MLSALKKQKAGKLLKKSVEQVSEYKGVQGVVKIDQYGDADRKAFLSVVRKGEFVVAE